MKRFFILAVSLLSTIVVMANQGEPSKREIKRIVVESYFDMSDYARYNMPISLLEEILSYSEWYMALDSSTRACADDEMAKWSKRHKLQKVRFKEYMDVALEMMTDENFDAYESQTVVNVYFDAIAELLYRGESDAACDVMMDLYIYMRAHNEGVLVEECLLAWKELNPEGFNVIMNNDLPTIEEERVIRNLGIYFGEDYSKMDRQMMVECYVRHIEGIVESYECGHEMDVVRHSLVLGYLYSLTDDETSYVNAMTQWTMDNPDKIESLEKVISMM